jgi:hypothetical protein
MRPTPAPPRPATNPATTPAQRLAARLLARRVPFAPSRRRPAAEAAGEPATPGDDGPPRGCAWFDSSLDLRAGLAVVEHAFEGWEPTRGRDGGADGAPPLAAEDLRALHAAAWRARWSERSNAGG